MGERAIAESMRSCVGQSFRPSNGAEGYCFEAAWCLRCDRDDAFQKDMNTAGCCILADALCFDIDAPEYPQEWIYGGDGQPVCTAFEPIKPSESAGPRVAPRCDKTMDLFE